MPSLTSVEFGFAKGSPPLGRHFPDKGKPLEKAGRKATGPLFPLENGQRGCRRDMNFLIPAGYQHTDDPYAVI